VLKTHDATDRMASGYAECKYYMWCRCQGASEASQSFRYADYTSQPQATVNHVRSANVHVWLVLKDTRAASIALLVSTMLLLQETESADAALGSSRCHRQGNVACKRCLEAMVETMQSRQEKAHHVTSACVLCDDGPAL